MRSVELVGPRGVRLRCQVAETRRERRRGLIGRPGLTPDQALLLPRATSVHTFGMRFPILIARLDRSFRVLDVRPIAPHRILLPLRRARHVLECAEDADVRIGDRLRLGREPAAQPRNARTSS